jgi:phosphate transport system permease protein
MAVTLDPRLDTVGAAPTPPPRRETPVRPTTFTRDDQLVLAGSAIAAFFLVFLVYSLLEQGLNPLDGWLTFGIWWYASFLAIYWLAVRQLHGRLLAADRFWSALIVTLSLLMLVPLVLIIAFVLYKGLPTITPHFFVETVQTCGQLDGPTCGGVGHAIVGTLEMVGVAIVMALPLAMLCAVFLNEIGGPLRRPVRLIVNAMSGVPSIVAGLFIYASWVVAFHRGFNGFGASLALAILMLPTITRTAEEVLRLVPDGLREGALALGASEWRTVWRVVLPTARSGLITAVLLGVARGVGETAPLIMTAFGSSLFNWNPFVGAQEALPQFIYTYIHFNPGSAPYQRAWSAAAVLIFLVLGLFTLARTLGARTSIEGRQRRAAKRSAKGRGPVGVPRSIPAREAR